MSSNAKPLRRGEKVQQRLSGATPVVVADASTLSFVLDPRGLSPLNSALTVRHGAKAVFTLAEAGDGTGSVISAGDVHYDVDDGPDGSWGASNGSSLGWNGSGFSNGSWGGSNACSNWAFSPSNAWCSNQAGSNGSWSSNGWSNGACSNGWSNGASSNGSRRRAAAPSYISFQTTGPQPSSSSDSNSDSGGPTSMTSMVERLRLGPGGFVTVPAAGTLNVLGRAFVGRDLLVEGTTYLESYGNLVDDFFSTSVTLPPTANALATAYRSLRNTE